MRGDETQKGCARKRAPARQGPLSLHDTRRALHIAENPDAGILIPESGGIRKVRWGRVDSGNSGGVRVVCFTRTAEEKAVLLTLYAKAQTDHLTEAKLWEIRRALES